MAGMFYSLQEAADRLNVTPEQIQEFVKQGRLREFGSGSEVVFKIDEVESLSSETGIFSSAPEEANASNEDSQGDFEFDLAPDLSDGDSDIDLEGETQIELSPEPPAAPEVSSGSEVELDLAGSDDSISYTDDIGLDTSSGVELTDADTAISGDSINVLGEDDSSEYALTGDTLGETASLLEGSSEASLEEIEESVNLDTFGSGSGLLDLSLQADDTSLGGILDEIYTPEGEGGGTPIDGSAMEVEAEADHMLERDDYEPVRSSSVEMVAPIRAPVAPMGIDPANTTFAILLFLPLLLVIYMAIIVMGNLIGADVTILTKLQGLEIPGVPTIWAVMGGLLLVALILGVIGLSKGSGGTKTKKVKAVKEKKPKAKKEKKPKKEKKKKK